MSPLRQNDFFCIYNTSEDSTSILIHYVYTLIPIAAGYIDTDVTLLSNTNLLHELSVLDNFICDCTSQNGDEPTAELTLIILTMTLEIVEPYSNADKVYLQIHANLRDRVMP